MATDSNAIEGNAAQLARRLTVAAESALSTLPNVSDTTHSTSTTTAATSISSSRAMMNDLIAGGIAGSIGITAGHPFDSIKVKMQMSPPGLGHVSATSTFIDIARNNQLGTLWRGVGAPVAMAAVLNASMFFTYGGCARVWDGYYSYSEPPGIYSVAKSTFCGGTAGIVSALVMCPAEHVKTKLQTQTQTLSTTSSSVVYRNSWHAARHILANHGIHGLYRGFAATTWRQFPGFMAYFVTYDGLKDYFQRRQSNDTQHNNSLLPAIAAGGIAGSVSWAVVYPIDLIKSRIQALPLDCNKTERSIAFVGRQLVQNQGWKAFYRGFGITVFRAFPVNATIFPLYDLTLRGLQQL